MKFPLTSSDTLRSLDECTAEPGVRPCPRARLFPAVFMGGSGLTCISLPRWLPSGARIILQLLLNFWRLLETDWDADEFRLTAGVTARELCA